MLYLIAAIYLAVVMTVDFVSQFSEKEVDIFEMVVRGLVIIAFAYVMKTLG